MFVLSLGEGVIFLFGFFLDFLFVSVLGRGVREFLGGVGFGECLCAVLREVGCVVVVFRFRVFVICIVVVFRVFFFCIGEEVRFIYRRVSLGRRCCVVCFVLGLLVFG